MHQAFWWWRTGGYRWTIACHPSKSGVACLQQSHGVTEHDDIAGKDQGSNFGQCCSLFGRVKKRTTTSRVERLLNRPARLEFADASRRKWHLVTQDAAELSHALPKVCAGFHCQVAPKVAPSTWCTSALARREKEMTVRRSRETETAMRSERCSDDVSSSAKLREVHRTCVLTTFLIVWISAMAQSCLLGIQVSMKYHQFQMP